MNTSKEKEEKVATILKSLSEELSFFPKETAQILYARQLADNPIAVTIPENVTLDKQSKTAEGNQRLKKMMEEARLKWEYASEAQKKQAAEMEALILESNEQIRKLYENATKA
jgi:hypothetical protein